MIKTMNLCLRQEVQTPTVRSEDTVGFRLQLSSHLPYTVSGRNIPLLMNDHPSLHFLFPPLLLSRRQGFAGTHPSCPRAKAGLVTHKQSHSHSVRLPNTPPRTHASTGRTCRLLAGRLQAWGWINTKKQVLRQQREIQACKIFFTSLKSAEEKRPQICSLFC